MSAGEFAAKAVADNPKMSNRSIAGKTGVSEATVRRARGASNDAPERRTGLDGKQHPVKHKQKPPRRESPEWKAKRLEAERRAARETAKINARRAQERAAAAADPTQYFVRAETALRCAVYTGPISENLVAEAERAARAWSELAEQLRTRLTAEAA
jgi:hypothetical protein